MLGHDSTYSIYISDMPFLAPTARPKASAHPCVRLDLNTNSVHGHSEYSLTIGWSSREMALPTLAETLDFEQSVFGGPNRESDPSTTNA